MSGRFRFEAAVAAACAGLAVLTTLVPEWIEVVTGLDPDAGSGALEWAVVLGSAALALGAALAAHLEWRRWRLPRA
jgi:hypothetical protein